MIEAKTVLELYHGHPERWTQGSIAVRETDGCPVWSGHPEAIKWCLMGALLKVYPSDDERQRIVQRISAKLNEQSLMRWNDSNERKFEDVVDVCRELGI